MTLSRGLSQTWAVVLAGGAGIRLRDLTRHIYGEDRPKQYAALTGGTSFLRQTLARIRLRFPPERTVVMTMAGQTRYLAAELRNESPAIEAPRRRSSSPPSGYGRATRKQR